MADAANHVHFFIAYLVSFVAFGLIAKWYPLPALNRHPLPTALSPLLLYACLRVNGLTFLMPVHVCMIVLLLGRPATA